MSEPTEPFTIKSVVSLDNELPEDTFDADNGGHRIYDHHELVADRDTAFQPGELPDEPTWPTPPRTPAEAYARAYARERFWRAYMRAPVGTRRVRKHRPLRERDFIRPTDPSLVCERCGKTWARARRGRGPIPRLCPDCRQASRNAN